MASAVSLHFVLLFLLVGATKCEVKCYKSQAIGDLEGNVYYCTDSSKPECCQENNEFTCCETAASKTWKTQLQLWGTVAAVVLVMAFVVYFLKSDQNCCNGSDERSGHTATLAPRLGITTKTEPPLTDLNKAGQPTVSNNGKYGRLPPVPAADDRRYTGSAGSGRGYPGKSNSAFDDDDYDYRY